MKVKSDHLRSQQKAATQRYRDKQIKPVKPSGLHQSEYIEPMLWPADYFGIRELHHGSSLSTPDVPYMIARVKRGGCE